MPRLTPLHALRLAQVLALTCFALLLAGVARPPPRDTAVPLSVTDLPGLRAQLQESPPGSPLLDLVDPEVAPIRVFTLSLEVPAALDGRRLWLRVQPDILGRAVLRMPGQPDQLTGARVARQDRSNPAVTGLLRMTLVKGTMQGQLLVQFGQQDLVHVQLLGETGLQDSLSRSTLYAGLFFGASLLITVLALSSWLGSGNTLYRDFAIYIGLGMLAANFVNAQLAAQWLALPPEVFARSALLSYGGYSVAGGLLAMRLLDLPRKGPRISQVLWALLAMQVVLAVTGAITGRFSGVTSALWALHSAMGVMLPAYALWSAWRTPTVRSQLVALALMVNAMFEKMPLLAMVGLLPLKPGTHLWPMVGLGVQMLLLHLLLVLELREQQQLAQRTALAQLEASKERTHRETLLRFLAMFGHEVRTPLAVIDSSTQSLELLPGAEQPEHRRRHRRIRAAIARLQSLASEALSRERIEAKGWQAVPKPMALRGLLAELLPRHGYELPGADVLPSGQPARATLPHLDRQHPLTLECLDLDLPFLADAAMLRLALDNLLDNAAKYSSAGSSLRLQIALADAGTPRLGFAVLNAGPALDASGLSQAFEKYWRSSEQSGVGGAGLGLYLVKLVALAHQGEVGACTLPDGLHRFSFSILWRPARPSPSHPP